MADVRDYALAVDGEVAEQTTARVQLGAAGTPSARATIKISYRLTKAGPHRFALQLQNSPDAMAWDDRRELVLDVADQINALVIGPEDADARGQPRPRSTAFYFQAALAPFEGAAAGGATVPWPIKSVYLGINQVQSSSALAGTSAVFVCDVPRIPAAFADLLMSYAANGGRLIWVLGPSIDSAAYNQVLLGNNRDLLPGPLAQPLVAAEASPIDWVDLHSPLFANLFESQEPFRSVLISGRWTLERGTVARGRALGKLTDGSPLLTEQTSSGGTAERVTGGYGGGGGEEEGPGKIYTLLTTPGGAWSNLGASVVLVPLASRMALGGGEGGGQAPGEGAIDTGQSVTLRIPGVENVPNPAALSGLTLDVTAPDNAVINVRAQMSGKTPHWQFDRTFAEGLYHWRSSDGRHEGMFAVNPPGDEADLLPADIEALARESSPGAITGDKPAIIAATAAELGAQMEHRGEGTSLVPGFLAMVLILALVEALMANRYRPGSVPVPA